MTNDDSAHLPPSADPATVAPIDEHQAPVAEPHRRSFGDRANSVVKRTLLALIGVAILVILYFVFRTVVPRQWADYLEGLVGAHASLTRGIIFGLAFGIVFTLVPVVCFALAVASWDRLRHAFGILFLLLGVAFAIPNVLTLAINTSHPTEPGPIWQAKNTLNGIIGFQGATLVGAVIGGLIGLVIVYFIVTYKVRGRKLKAAALSADED